MKFAVFCCQTLKEETLTRETATTLSFQRQKERRKMERGERMEEASEQVSNEEPECDVMYVCYTLQIQYRYVSVNNPTNVQQVFKHNHCFIVKDIKYSL